MTSVYDVETFLNKYLGVDHFQDVDVVINGLEVEGRETIERAVFAVSLTEKVVEEAVKEKADAIFLHHGILLKGERGALLSATSIRGSLRRKLKLILENDINVFAYHLPLDAHPEIGNNVTLAKMLGLVDIEWISEVRGPPIGVIGKYLGEVPVSEVLQLVRSKINPEAILLKYGPDKVRRVAIVSGAGARYVMRFRRGEIDLFITGEFREECEVYAQDEGINVIIAGHYATEIVGVRNLADLVSRRFNIEVKIVETGQKV